MVISGVKQEVPGTSPNLNVSHKSKSRASFKMATSHLHRHKMKFILLAYLSSLCFAQEKVAGLELKEAQRRLDFTKRTLDEANRLNADKHNAAGVADAKKAVAQLQAIVDQLSIAAANASYFAR